MSTMPPPWPPVEAISASQRRLVLASPDGGLAAEVAAAAVAAGLDLVAQVPDLAAIGAALAEHGAGLAIVDATLPGATATVTELTAAGWAVVAVAGDGHRGVVELAEAGVGAVVVRPLGAAALASAVVLAGVSLWRARRQTDELATLRAQLLTFAAEFGGSYARERARGEQLAEALAALEGSYLETVRFLARAVEARDFTTGRHIERVTALAEALVGAIAPELAGEPWLRYGFMLHDLGKIGIPEAILLKPGPLTPAEREVMQAHPMIGVRIVEPVEFLSQAATIVRSHHERFDGAGYPDGLKATEIPLSARVFAVADAADAMLHDRPYRRALSLHACAAELRAQAGAQFDPVVVQAFLDLTRRPGELAGALAGGIDNRIVEDPTWP